jgi:hypothetical protein
MNEDALRIHQHARQLVAEVRAGDINAPAEILSRIDHVGTLRFYAIAFAAIAARAQRGRDADELETPEDGADSDGETR